MWLTHWRAGGRGRGKAEPDRGADWPRRRAVGCAGLLVGRLAGRDRVPHPGPPPSSATTEPHHPGAVYRDGPTGAPCSRWYPISGRPGPPPDGQPRAAGAARAEQFDLQPRHINTAIDFAATPVIGAQLRPTIKRPNTRASLLPAAPSCVGHPRAVRRRQGRLMPLSGDRTARDLWVMSQPVAVSSRLAGLKHAGHDQSPVPAIAPHHAVAAVAPRFVPKSVPNFSRRSQPQITSRCGDISPTLTALSGF